MDNIWNRRADFKFQPGSLHLLMLKYPWAIMNRKETVHILFRFEYVSSDENHESNKKHDRRSVSHLPLATRVGTALQDNGEVLRSTGTFLSWEDEIYNEKVHWSETAINGVKLNWILLSMQSDIVRYCCKIYDFEWRLIVLFGSKRQHFF